MSKEKNQKQFTASTCLAIFRIAFGGIMIWEISRYLKEIQGLFITPPINFYYPLTPFIKAPPQEFIYIFFGLMAVFALGILLGYLYRIASIGFFLMFTYFFLIDQSMYLNHFYVVCLFSFLFSLTNANHSLSIDAYRKRKETIEFPSWNIAIFQFMIIVIYFYGAIAKLNPDWLNAEPIGHWLRNKSNSIDLIFNQNFSEILKTLFAHQYTSYFFAYTGIIFDFLIGFLLLSRKTRKIALIPAAIFHLTNAFVFRIGIFPWMMLCSCVLFFEKSEDTKENKSDFSLFTKRILASPKFIQIFILLQLVLPFRHFLYQGNTCWNEQGHLFAWRMKLCNKSGFTVFVAKDKKTKQTWSINPTQILKTRQLPELINRPHMILQYAHYLKEFMEKKGVKDPEIRAISFISLNGRKLQQMIDPNVDLANEDYKTFVNNKWILPLTSDEGFAKYEQISSSELDNLINAEIQKINN